eukprot:TRINITY_DN339_c0_g2_i1.p1 TRINITY_DN339_c0_g2~~TRINITY_DN339_c0_g2_i1.p1  ORF type:complete len:419 (-),score=87.07 TRINITY_DN339_c0_g2_i1:309-1565(-)
MQQQLNYYDILGVKPDASDTEVRSAFRRLALQYHPDKIKDPFQRKLANKTFQSLSTAYRILSDPEQRRRYDQNQSGQFGDFNATTARELFQRFFGTSPSATGGRTDRRRARSPSSSDDASSDDTLLGRKKRRTSGSKGSNPIVAPFSASLEDIYKGCRKRVRVTTRSQVTTADSSSSAAASARTAGSSSSASSSSADSQSSLFPTMPSPLRSDNVRDGAQERAPTPRRMSPSSSPAQGVPSMTPQVQAQGPAPQQQQQEQQQPTPARTTAHTPGATPAHGRGVTTSQTTVTVDIERGCQTGSRVTYQVAGQTRPIVLVMSEKPHKHFTRRGDDLVYTHKLTLMQALGGFQAKIPTIAGGEHVIERKQVTSPNDTITVAGLGMPKLNTDNEYGNLEIKFDITFPREVTAQQMQALSAVF